MLPDDALPMRANGNASVARLLSQDPESINDHALATKVAVPNYPIAVAAVWLTVAECFRPTLVATGWFAICSLA